MKTASLIIIILLLIACKSKQTVKQLDNQNEVVNFLSAKDSTKSETKVQEKKTEKQILQSDHKKESQTEIEIKGKAEIDKPVEMYNIENGDTLQSIKVTGTAEVKIRTKTSKLDQVKKDNSSESFTEKLKEFSQNIVREHNLKERVSKAKTKLQKVSTKTGTFWSFGIITIMGIVLIIVIGIIIYLKK